MSEIETSGPKIVLLAEDDPVNQEIVRHILSRLEGIELIVVSDGRAALEHALERRFDLMIFDRQMPFIPGDKVIRHLKAAKTINSGTPIIQFTAAADRVAVREGATAFADAIVPKPIQATEFLSVVTRLLGS